MKNTSTIEVKRDILWRVYLSFIAIVLVCVVVLSKAFYIQQVQGDQWRSKSDSMHQKIVELDAERGTIYSEDGQMLSTSIPQFDIYIDFGAEGLRDKSGKLFRQHVDSLSYSLSNLFKDKSWASYKKILNDGYAKKTRYFLLKKKISFKDYQQLRHFPLVRLGRNKSGFIPEVKSIRLNPYQLLAYRTIGLNRTNAQKIGLEQTYDSVLKGNTGKRLVRYIGGGVSVPVDGALDIEPENGKDVVTTLNVHMQEIAENALMSMMQQSESQTGTCIVMETKTGKIKAIANLGRRPDGSYWEDYNYAMRATEPGSTIKLATLLSVLSEGKTSINNLVDVGSTGRAFVGVREVNDAERAPKPVMTVAECFAHSSNVGFSKIAYNSFAQHPDKFMKYLHQYRLDTITGINLLGESKPRMPRMKRNTEGLSDMITMSFGYAIQVSPLQTLTLYNAIANNGNMMKPYLVNSIQSDGAIITQYEPTVLKESICQPHVVKAAQQCMEAVTTYGTGKPIFQNSPYKVAGKTGTAHVADGKYGYNDGVYQASFVGYFPADNPQFSCIVVIKTKPNAQLHFGGQLAAPVFKEISDRLYSMYVQHSDSLQYASNTYSDSISYNYVGMKSDVSQMMNALNIPFKEASATGSDWVTIYKKGNAPATSDKAVPTAVMPSLQGMGLKDAVYLCENMGLKVKVKGVGKVTAQSISSGNKISKGQVVSIALD